MRPAPVLAAILAAGLTFGLGVGAALSHLGPTALASDAAGPAADQASPSHGKGAPPDVPTELTATLAFGGDMLIHMPVANSARTGSGYDFSPLLAGVDPWIANADLAICQMETPVTPPGQSPSGFPIFAAPPELVADMAEQGWDGCTTASNHSVDKGWAGVEATIGALKDAGMGYSGTALSQEDSNQPQLYRISRGAVTLTVAHIAFTYGTNGLPVPAAQPWSVNTPIDVAKVVQQATAARQNGADLVIASIHAGVEYRTTPTEQQRQIAAELASSGQIDAMIGDHPHVAEPIELVPGGVDGRGMWTIYSLGNFLSNQQDSLVGPNTDTGAVAYLTVTKDQLGTRVDSLTWAAVTVDYAHRHRVHMLEDSVNQGGTLGELNAAAVTLRYNRMRTIMGESPERLTPPEPSGATLEVIPRT